VSSEFDVSFQNQSQLVPNGTPSAASEYVPSLEEAMSTPEGKIYFDLIPMVFFNDVVAIQRCRKHFEGPYGYTLLSLLNKTKAPKSLKDSARILIRYNLFHKPFQVATVMNHRYIN
jgi:hypothetical protein